MYMKYKPVIYRDGSFHKVKPYIVKATNTSSESQLISYKAHIYKILDVTDYGFITSNNYTFVTSDNDYFVAAE